MKNNLSTRVTNSIIRYVEHQGGNIDALLAGLPYDLDYLTSLDKWVPAEIQGLLIERAGRILYEGNVARNIGRFGVTPKVLGLVSAIARMFSGPETLYKKGWRYVPFFNRTQRGRSTVNGNECIFEISHLDLTGYCHLGCEEGAGTLEAIPQLFDLPPAVVDEETCQLPIERAGKVGGLYYDVNDQGAVTAYYDKERTRSAGVKGQLEADGSFMLDGVKFGSEYCRYRIKFQEKKGFWKRIRDFFASRHAEFYAEYTEELEMANISMEKQFDEMKRREFRFMIQSDLGAALIHQYSIEEKLSLVTNSVLEIDDAFLCRIHLLEKDNSMRYAQGEYSSIREGRVKLLTEDMSDLDLYPQTPASAVHPHLLEIISEGLPLVAGEVKDFIPPFCSSDLGRAIKENGELLRLVLFPLRVEENPLGIMTVASTSEIDVESLQLIANMASQTIWNIRLMEEIRESKEHLDELVKKRTEQVQEANLKLKESHVFIVQQEKMASIGQLAAGVAHELNNPLAYILSNLNSMRDYVKDLRQYFYIAHEYSNEAGENSVNECENKAEKVGKTSWELDIEEIIDDIEALTDESRDGAKRARDIVVNLKNFSRPGEKNPILADINNGIESTISIIGNEIKYRARLNKELGDLPLIPCYPHELNQVVLNLIINAAHSVKEQGNIWIRTRRNNGYIEIEVEDEGEGILSENMSNIFEPFFTTKPVGMGTGLGLAISYGIVKRHKGEILVESEPGKGAKFTVRLPTKGVELESQLEEKTP